MFFYSYLKAGQKKETQNLSVLIKGHDHHCSSIAFHRSCLIQKVRFSFLQTDAVNNTLPLTTLQTSLDDREVGWVNAQRNLKEEGDKYLLIWVVLKTIFIFMWAVILDQSFIRLCLLILSSSLLKFEEKIKLKIEISFCKQRICQSLFARDRNSIFESLFAMQKPSLVSSADRRKSLKFKEFYLFPKGK